MGHPSDPSIECNLFNSKEVLAQNDGPTINVLLYSEAPWKAPFPSSEAPPIFSEAPPLFLEAPFPPFPPSEATFPTFPPSEATPL